MTTLPTAADLATCVYCPKLCRHVCPVAVGTSREAAVPSVMALHPFRFLRGEGGVALAIEAAALCVECGACEAHCEVHRPLGAMLGALRRGLTPPPQPAPLEEVEGEGRLVAIEEDPRQWGPALAKVTGKPVARLRTVDHLGALALDHPLSPPGHAAALRAALAGRVAVVADHRTMAALRAAGAEVVHLAELVELPREGLAHAPCAGPRLAQPTANTGTACCGATGGLPGHHPARAAEVARYAARTLDEARSLDGRRGDATAPVRSPDCSCARALRGAGLHVVDAVDLLLGMTGSTSPTA